MLRIRYEVDDGTPLVVKQCTPGLGVSGAKLKLLVAADNLGGEETSFVFSVDSPDGGRRTLRDSDAFALGETGTVICLHLRSRSDGLSVNTAVNGPAWTLDEPVTPEEPVSAATQLGKRSPDSCRPLDLEGSPAAAAAAAEDNDCGACVTCQDKPRFGGPGVKRKGCLNRKGGKAPRASSVGIVPLAQRAQGMPTRVEAQAEVEASKRRAEAAEEAARAQAEEADGESDDGDDDDDEEQEEEQEEEEEEEVVEEAEAEAEAEEVVEDRMVEEKSARQVTRATRGRAREEPTVRADAPTKRTRRERPEPPPPRHDESDHGSDSDVAVEGAPPSDTLADEPWRTDAVEPGALVWAKMHGFPWWPAQLRRISGDGARVRFCGARQLGLVELSSHVLPFASRPAWCDEKQQKIKRSMLAKYRAAVGEARAAAAGQLVWPESEDVSESEVTGGEEEEAGEEGEEGEEGEDEEGEAEDEDESVIEPMNAPGHEPGALVWAKLPCFPCWPATVQPPSRSIAQPHSATVFVRFFGPESYAWVEVGAHLTPFIPEEPACVLTQVKKSLRGKWKRAVEEATAAHLG